MCRAMYRTQKWIHAHGGRALARAIRDYFPGLPEATLVRCCEYYIELGLWNRDPVLQRAGLEWLRDAALAAGLLKTNFSYEDVTEMRYARHVLAEDPPQL